MNYPEAAIQTEIVENLKWRGIMVFAVPNERKRTAAQAVRAKNMGVRAGVSDLVVLMEDRVIFLEVKSKGGRQTPKQKDFMNAVRTLGFEYYLVKSWEAVQQIIETSGE